MTVKQAYLEAKTELSKRYETREAQNILSQLLEDKYKVTNVDRKEPFSDEEYGEWQKDLSRLLDGMPVQYITGIAHFYGYQFRVNPHVLIPRPETEELVHWILEDNKGSHRQKEVLEIGTGSGCISITLKLKKPSFRVFGVEESMDAMNVTRINAKIQKVAMEYFRFDFLDKTIWPAMGMFDIIVSNPPYIPHSEQVKMLDSVLGFEPEEALFVDDEDPLVFYRNILDFASNHLKESGSVYLELNEFNALEVKNLYLQNGFENIEIRSDLQGKPRMLKASNY